jgi:integrase
VRAFVIECAAQQKKPATIRRYLATITRAHLAAGGTDPCLDESVKLAMRATARTLGTRQKQARALSWDEIALYLTIPPEQLRDYRDRALIAIACDTMCRSEELVTLDVEHFEFQPDGSGTVLIGRSKTDQEGQGATAYVAPSTVRAYLDAGGQ